MMGDPSVERPAGGRLMVTPPDGREDPGRGSLPGFFVLTFAVSWAFFIAVALWSRRTSADDATVGHWAGLITLPGVFAPALVAIALSARARGEHGVRELLAPLFRWQVPTWTWSFALGYMAAIKLLAALVHRLAFGAWPRFGGEPWMLMLAATVFSVLVFGQAGEEVGWRGYALPRMAARWGLGWASIVLGAIWAFWHLPLFWLRGIDKAGQSFPFYLLQVTALSVAIAWLWWRTGGSLTLTMLLHAAVNNTKDIVPSATPGAMHVFGLAASRVGWITMGLLWLSAAFFLVDMRRARGAPRE
jgi:membrane protease YdiL (CAAX protease family)